MKSKYPKPKYRKIILKLSGEFLGSKNETFDQTAIRYVVEQIVSAKKLGVRIGVVVGAGNIIRGRDVAWPNKIDTDMCGMMATVINGVLLQSMLNETEHEVKLSSALAVDGIAERFTKFADLEFYNSGGIVVFTGGTGNPLFTTDTAAALRAVQFGADVLIKGTKVAGVYSSDPQKNKRATLYKKLTYDRAIAENLQVMDMAAFNICRAAGIPICVYDFTQHRLTDVIAGETLGTIISGGRDD